jgi:hypothetical protein
VFLLLFLFSPFTLSHSFFPSWNLPFKFPHYFLPPSPLFLRLLSPLSSSLLSLHPSSPSLSELLEHDQDYLPAVLGMATGFMVEKAQVINNLKYLNLKNVLIYLNSKTSYYILIEEHFEIFYLKAF